MTSDDSIGTADTMRERGNSPGIRLLLLMRLDRLVLTAVLALVVFFGFVVAVTALEPTVASQIESGDLIDTMFSSMLTVIVTGSTLVVSIGQLVLSQENGPLGDQRSRMSNTMDFREYTGELIGDTTPADPSTFLSELVHVTAEKATALRDSLSENDNQEVRTEVDEFTESVIGNAEEVTEQLDGAEFGTFDVLFAALNFNYSWKIFQVERIATDHADHLDEADRRLLEELKTALSLFGPAREHVKTLYFQWELIGFSQWTLYTAVPALMVAGVMLGVVDAGTFPGETVGVANVVWVVGGAFAVTLVPFLLFVSYLLRILTVAKRTLAIGPLILRESQR
jgi:hypothetical protein